MANFSIPEQLLNNVFDYLSQRPFVEVFKLIQELQQKCKVIPEPSVPPMAEQKILEG